MLQFTLITLLAAAVLAVINIRLAKDIKKRINDIDDGINTICRLVDNSTNSLNEKLSAIKSCIDGLRLVIDESRNAQLRIESQCKEIERSIDSQKRHCSSKVVESMDLAKALHADDVKRLDTIKQVLETYEEVLAIQKQNIEDYRAKMADKAVADAENLAFAQRMYATIKERRVAGESLAHIAKSLDGNQYKTRDLAMLLANGDAMKWPTTIEDLVPGMKEDIEQSNE